VTSSPLPSPSDPTQQPGRPHWLARSATSVAGPTPHQFALFRIALGVVCVCCLGAGLGGESSQIWLDAPRAARMALRAGGSLLGVMLTLGVGRRSSGASLGLIAVLEASLGFFAWPFALRLLLLCGLATYPKLESEAWTLLGRAPVTDSTSKGRTWTLLAWLTCASSLTFMLVGVETLNIALGMGFASLLVWIGWRGPSRTAIAALFVLDLLLAWRASTLSAELASWLPLLCALASFDWLPARATAIEPLVFYDGVCGLCQRGVQLILVEDRNQRLKLAPLQGSTARSQLPRDLIENPQTMVLAHGSRILERSEAALAIAEHLGGIWALAAPLGWVPFGLRDALYRWIAANRYAWFGQLESCPVPDARVRSRFLP
jgi:predicted DCC family thiol-disulfide oxidoreductase YuxK